MRGHAMFQNYISQRLQIIRSYRHGIGKSAVICPAAFLASVAVASLLLGLNFYAKDTFGASATSIGWLYGAWFSCYIVACLFVRPLTDRFQPRHVILFATSLMCVASLLMPFCGSMTGLTICAACMGTVSSLFWPQLMGWLSIGSEGKQLGRALSYFAFSFSIGGIIAPPLTGWLSELQPALPLYGAALLLLLTTALITGATLALPKVRAGDDTPDEPNGSSDQDTSSPLRFPAWLALVTAFVANGILVGAFPVMTREQLHFSKGLIGGILTWPRISQTAGFLLMGWLTLWHFKGRFMILNQLAFAAVMAALAVTRTAIGLSLLLIVFGFLQGQAYTSSIFHGCSGSNSRPRRMALHESLLSAGFILGSVAGGWVYQRFSMPALYYSSSALFCLAAAAQILFSLYLRRRTPQAPAPE